MGTGLLSSTGLDPKRLSDIRTDLETAMRGQFGESLDLGADTPEGKIVGIVADRLNTIWEAVEAVYNAQYPGEASGVSLDRVSEMTAVTRRAASRSTVTLYVRGSVASIPAGSIVENVDTGIQFRTTTAASIPSGGDLPLTTNSGLAVTSITRSGTTCTVTTTSPHGLVTGCVVTIAGAVETGYNVTGAITVTGASTFTYEVDTAPGSPATGTITYSDEGLAADHLLLTTVVARSVAHGLTTGDYVFVHDADQATGYNGLFQVTVLDVDHFSYVPTDAITETPATGSYNADDAIAVAAESVDTGPQASLAGKLTVIVTPASGWDAVANYLDATTGLDEENDADLRIRRIEALSGLGNATAVAIRGDLLNVADVVDALVFENDTDETVSNRPPHSVECLVDGGAAADIVAAIWASKAAGIETYGTSSSSVVDSQGFTQTVYFSRPDDVEIYLNITLTVDASYPSDGDAQVEAAVLAWAAGLSIGDDVIVYPYLVGSFMDIQGILTVVIDIGTTASPSGDSNITISEVQRAKFDSSRTTVASS